MRPLFLALALAGTATAQHDHAAPTAVGPTDVAETFTVEGFRVDVGELPPGSAVGRAGLRYGDGGYVGVVHGKPYARGRVVFGGVVALNTVWAAGAHQQTELYTTVPLQIGGTRVAPGAYGLFVTPRVEGWTLHVNRALGMHLADEYDPALDVATVSVRSEVLDPTSADPSRLPVEGLTWSFAGDGSALRLAWDRVAASFPIARASE